MPSRGKTARPSNCPPIAAGTFEQNDAQPFHSGPVGEIHRVRGRIEHLAVVKFRIAVELCKYRRTAVDPLAAADHVDSNQHSSDVI